MRYLFLIFLAVNVLAGGPKYSYEDHKLDDEINNIYHDIGAINSSGIRGSTTNNNAQAGFVGEYIESLISSGASTGATGTFFDSTSISLTAGDWDVTGIITYQINSAVFTTLDAELAITTTSGNSSTGAVLGSNYILFVNSTILGTSGFISLIIPSYRVSLSGTTTHYLKGYLDHFTSGTPKYTCRLSARRVR